jgi:hypothetical protein
VAALVLALGGGCVTETRPDTGGPPPSARKRPAAPKATPHERPPPRTPGEPNEPADPCATRLHDLSGLLLMYYSINKHLPDRLDELASLADVDLEFNTNCPASGQPYVYDPAGLGSPTSDRFLVLYDSVPAHGGLRWGVFVAPPRDGKPPATWVILMSEEVFRGYSPRK